MGRTAVKDVTTTIARLILRNPFRIREAEDAHHQRALCIVLGKRCRSILWVRLVRIQIGGLITVGTTGHRFHILELRQFRQSAKHVNQIRIGEVALVKQLTNILDSRGYRLDEVGLSLKIASETVCTQHLQLAEQYKQGQALDKTMGCRHLGKLLQGIVVLIDQFTTQLVGILG